MVVRSCYLYVTQSLFNPALITHHVKTSFFLDLKQQLENLKSEIEDLQAQLEMARTERDEAIEFKNGSHELELTVESLTNDLNSSVAKLGELSQQKEKDEEKIEELSSRVEQLVGQVQQLTAEQDSLVTTKLSLESDLEGYEQNAQEQEKTVDQWAGKLIPQFVSAILNILVRKC